MKRHLFIVAAVGVAALVGAGCASVTYGHNHRATSLYQYLYSDENSHVDKPTIPTLSLPLRVGVAFVPADASIKSAEAWELPEEDKITLMKQVSAQFKAYAFVKSIDLIPTFYLTPRGGFANLDQLRTMHGIDVMTLVSYDQIQFTGNNWSSLTYATPVGLLFIQGEKNETKTMLDAAVYDIASRKMLFRAPGLSSVKDSSTLMNQDLNLKSNREQGYQEASTNLVTNLRWALEDFKTRVKDQPEEYKVVSKPGYHFAAGAFGPMDVLLVVVFGSASLWVRRQSEV